MARVIIPGRLNNSNLGTPTGVASPNYGNGAQERFMTLRCKGVPDVVLQYAPRETSHSGLSAKWEEIARAGQEPLIVAAPKVAERMSFECTLAAAQPRNITAEMQALRKMAKSKDPITVSYTDWEGAGFWRITDMTIDVTLRSSIDHSPTMAKVSLEMIALPGTSSSTGMLSGGIVATNNGGTTPGARSYIVKAGDTLWSIAVKFYGNGDQWTVIGSANRITNPRVQLGAGMSLKIPSL